MNYKRLTGERWVEYLIEEPDKYKNLCDKYNGWKKIKGYSWVKLLINNLQFKSKCDEYNGWGKFDGCNWYKLLENSPQFADKCDEYNGWEKIEGIYWYELLKKYPYFLNKLENQMHKLSEYDWTKILKIFPHLVKKCNEYNKFKNFDKYCWDKLFFENNNYNYNNLILFILFDLSEHKNNISEKLHYLINAYNSLQSYDDFIDYIKSDIKNIEQFKNYMNIIVNNLDINKIKEKIGIDILNIKLLIDKTNNLEIIKEIIEKKRGRKIKK